MQIKILGAGLAGLLAYNFFKNEEVIIYEKCKKENFLSNHNALLRLKKDELPRMLGIDYIKIEIEKNYLYNDKLYTSPNIRMLNEYSLKVSDKIEKRSIRDDYGNERIMFDLSDIDPKKYPILFDSEINTKNDIGDFDYCISTLPMNINSKIFNIKSHLEMKSKPIYVYYIYLNIKTEINQTIYICSKEDSAYRATLQNNIIILEGLSEIDKTYLFYYCGFFGIYRNMIMKIEKRTQDNGKISDMDDIKRKTFLYNLTSKQNVFSLGRYAVWKTKLMLDDLLDDLYKIKRMMSVNKEVIKYENKLN